MELHHQSMTQPVVIGTLTNNLYVSKSESFITLSTSDSIFVSEESDIQSENKSEVFISHKWHIPDVNNIDTPGDLANINTLSTTKDDLTLDFLHKRFGHADVNKIKQLLRQSAVDGLEIQNDSLTPKHYCEHCIIAKSTVHSMHRGKSSGILPSKRIRHVNKELYFEMVTSDLLGPIQVASLDNKRYGITFTEIKSRYRWFYTLKHKSEAVDALKLFHAEITAHGFTIKILKTDNGGEFISTEFKDFLQAHNSEIYSASHASIELIFRTI